MNRGCYAIYLGDSRIVLETLLDNSVDAIVCDPPYGLGKEPNMLEVLGHWLKGDDYTATGAGFMGKTWDSFVPGPSVWRECLRVLKPGGHLLSFFGGRTYDMGVLAVRLAGFEIRDCIQWIYGSGYPKSMNVARAVGDISPERGGSWQGWGTALKPAYEPIVVARKPLSGTTAQNVIKYGTGALHIDACRIAPEQSNVPDRWPANVVHDGSQEVLAGFHDKESKAARFFYCPKVSRSERHEGLENPGPQFKRGATLRKIEAAPKAGNHHPTVKPVDLMAYLCRLVTPTGGCILDPFMGSGSTGKAALREGFSFVGIEREPEYYEIALKRIEHEILMGFE